MSNITSLKPIIEYLDSHPVMGEGTRNNDAVDLCIMATYMFGLPRDLDDLFKSIEHAMAGYNIKFCEDYDQDDFDKRVSRIYPYLDTWYGNQLLSYAFTR